MANDKPTPALPKPLVEILESLTQFDASDPVWDAHRLFRDAIDALAERRLGERSGAREGLAAALTSFHADWPGQLRFDGPGPTAGDPVFGSLSVIECDRLADSVRALSSQLADRKQLVVEVTRGAERLAACDPDGFEQHSVELGAINARILALTSEIKSAAERLAAELKEALAARDRGDRLLEPYVGADDSKAAVDIELPGGQGHEVVPAEFEVLSPNVSAAPTVSADDIGPSDDLGGEVASSESEAPRLEDEIATAVSESDTESSVRQESEAVPADSDALDPDGEAAPASVTAGDVFADLLAVTDEGETSPDVVIALSVESDVEPVEVEDAVGSFDVPPPPVPHTSGDRIAPESVETLRSRPELPAALTPPLQSFEDFASSHFVTADGRCVTAPWLEPHFAHDLSEAASRALVSNRLGIVRVLCAAAEKLGVPPLFYRDDLDAAAAIWRSPMSFGVGLSVERSRRLSRVASGQATTASALGLSALLEALRPSTTVPLSETDVKVLESKLQLENRHLQTLISRILLLNCRNAEPVRRLQSASADLAVLSKEDRERQLDRARSAFARKAQTLATGGSVTKVDFARRSWRRSFDDLIRPLAEVFRGGGVVDDYVAWDLEELRRMVLTVPEVYARYADDDDVRHSARDQMDKAMEQLVETALAVIDAAADARRSTVRTSRPLDLPSDSLLELSAAAPLQLDVEEFMRRIAVRALSTSSVDSQDEWRLTWEDLCEYPELLLLVEDTSVAGGDVWGGVSPRWIEDPVRAGATVLGTPRTVSHGSRDLSLRDLHNAARDTGRFDIAVFVASAGLLSAHDRNRDRSDLFELTAEAASEVSRLQLGYLEADELGLPISGEIKLLFDDATWLSRDDAWMTRHVRLFRAWISELSDAVNDLVSLRCDELLREAEALPVDRKDYVAKAVNSRQFGKAVEGLYSKRSLARPTVPSDRVTIWRDVARRQYSNPVATIQKNRAAGEKLVAGWTELHPTSATQRKTRIAFFDFLEAGSGSKSASRVVRRGEPKFETIELDSLRSLFRSERLNPTFVPQLHQVSELIIASAGISDITKRTETPEDVVRSITSLLVQENRLVVALAPGVSEQNRETAIADLRSREISGAVIDDLDLCRLLSIPTGPRRWLGLLEIVFEQISWRQTGPFVADDGQFVRREMFVGRTQEAKDLALTTHYSRIFSGRRLGKSALLKFVDMQYQNSRMPSGNRLTTVYVGAAGSQPDASIVSDIIDHVQRKFGVELAYAEHPDPGERLVRALKKFASEQPTESILIVLDEADVFVEEQLTAYDRVAESCLAFRMMKSFGESVDKLGAPRIRFVVAGYRVTNTNYGPWFNSGDVLRLPPLDEADAARLIEGPLARIGIDASGESRSIARRCGYQPAVLLKFGEVLLRRLHDRGAAAWQGRVEVSRDDVVAVINDTPVTEAIRYVIDQNFGNHNPVGAIVFTAFLWALGDRPAAWCIENAAETILGYVRLADEDTAWLKAIDPTEVGEIERHLNEQVDRQLLEKVTAGDRTVYRLKFPNLLSQISARTDPAVSIRKAIGRLRESGDGTAAVTSVLAAKSLKNLYDLTQDCDPEYPVSIVVVAGHWTAAVEDPHSGIASRLGYTELDIISGPDLPPSRAASDKLCSIATTPELGERILAERPPRLAASIASGGIDLLRWALRRELVDGPTVDIVALGRLTLPALTWWFERARGHEFEDTNAVARIHQFTSGIPLLVSAVDQLVDVPKGDTVSRSKLASVLATVGDALPAIARQLVDGAPAARLTERELELMRMIALTGGIGREPVDDVLCGDVWDSLFSEQLPTVSPLYSVSEDRIALDVLKKSGIVPLDHLNRLDFARDDALLLLVAAIDAQ